jgi:hypothetical protein
MYKDKDKQKESNRERQRRYREKQKGVTDWPKDWEGVTVETKLMSYPPIIIGEWAMSV